MLPASSSADSANISVAFTSLIGLPPKIATRENDVNANIQRAMSWVSFRAISSDLKGKILLRKNDITQKVNKNQNY